MAVDALSAGIDTTANTGKNIIMTTNYILYSKWV
jgi:hypothetical protein